MSASIRDLTRMAKRSRRRYLRSRSRMDLLSLRADALRLQLRTPRTDPRQRPSLWCSCCDLEGDRACVDCFVGIDAP